MYAPIHLHTTYSVLDGAIKVPELARRLKELQIPACAVTEHGNVHSLIEAHKEFKKQGIKHIPGIEAYITNDPDDSENKNRDNYHLVLLARNNKGLENLIWLSTQSHLHNFYYKPRIWMENLKDHSKGLIATSACLGNLHSRTLRYEGDIQKAFIDNYQDYIYKINWFREVFNGDYYLEIQDHDFWQQKEYNRIIIDIARKNKFPLVITSDAHYLKKEDSYIHEMMMAMQFKQTLEQYREGDAMKYGGTNYVYSDEEMCAAAKKWDAMDAMENTVKIAEQCEEIDLGLNKQFFMPTFDYTQADDYSEFLEWRKENQ